MSAELVNSYINDIAKRLHDPNQYGSASVMVGAGFSKNAVSLSENSFSPSWEELARKMYESLYPFPEKEDDIAKWDKNMIKKTTGKNVLKLAEEFKVVFGRNKLDRFIEENIDDEKFIPGDLHFKLLELNWNDVFTTNYDTLLERAINNISVRKNYKILLSQNDLPGSTHPRVTKLHGSIPNAKPYIICEEDYRTYPIKYAPFVNTVQQSMLETQLCLIGFSGDDPNFLNWLGWLRDNMGENCPQIYLCGVFSDMSESEKKMLESQNISVVNLEYLIDEKSSNRHYDALEMFFNKLKSYGKNEKSIFQRMPYKYRSLSDKIDDKYYDTLIRYTNEAKLETSKYLVLPFTELKGFSEELSNQFRDLSREKNDINKFILMGNFVFLLRKLYMPLDDYQARKIQELVKEFSYETLIQNSKYSNYRSLWVEMMMYLAEMYRIDGENQEYIKTIKDIESKLPFMDAQQKADYYIEKCKFSISQFDYSEALNYVKKIDESISYEVQIKKACIISQIGENDNALDLLKRCSASLAQKSYSEDKTASLISYMNICSRSLNIYNNFDDFSDQNFIDNKYNIRKIFNDVKSSLSSNLLLAENKREKGQSSFNPNSHTYSYGTTPKEIVNATGDSFRYLLLQDNLCLPPQYSDHREVIAKAAKELIPTSKNPIWKWSYIIRTNDDKIINRFFSREMIVTSSMEWAEKLFDQLITLLESFQKHEHYNRVKKILTQKIIYEVLSRVCIALDDGRILMLLERNFQVLPEIDNVYNGDMRGILARLSYCFNSEILKKSLVKIFELPSFNIPITSYFHDINADITEIDVPEELVLKAIQEISNPNIDIRDNGISKIVLLNEYKGLSGYHEPVSKALWGQVDEYGFPKSKIYSKALWETLPHEAEICFEELYANYLKKPDFPRCVEGGIIHGFTNVDGLIHSYMNCAYIVSNFAKRDHSKITWNEELINSILAYIYDYLDNEKKLFEFGFDIFGNGEEAKRRFLWLSDLVAMLITQATISNCYNEIGQEWVGKIKILFAETQTTILSIEIIESIRLKRKNSIYELIIRQILSGSAEEVLQAFTALDIVLVYRELIDSDIRIVDELKGLFNAIKYMDIRNSRSILLHLPQIIDRKIFLTDEFGRVITQSLKECLDIYEIVIKEINKDYLDAMFNLSNLTKKYYKALINNKMLVPDEIASLVDRFKNSSLNEVRNAWEGVGK